MNILFITLCNFATIYERNIYTDLLRQFCEKGHRVFVLSPNESDNAKETQIVVEGNCKIVRVKVSPIQKTNVIRKGINMLRLESLLKKQYIQCFSEETIDLVMYSTPPITICKLVEYVKRKNNAFTFLLLKDIFPQNAVDLKMMSAHGLLYRFFRYKEKELYKLSDYIGCMSEANVNYIKMHNTFLDVDRIGVSPNCLEVNTQYCVISDKEYADIRKKYDIPVDKRVFLYGGNLGKPQNIAFITECLQAVQNMSGIFFVICGTGTEYPKLEEYVLRYKPEHLKLMQGLPRADYDELVKVCDVGLLFLDYRFEIPNFPSRLLSYMEYCLPVLACTDPNTDVGTVIENGNFGWSCLSNSAQSFKEKVCQIKNMSETELAEMGNNGRKYLEDNYNVVTQCEDILEVVSGTKRI